MRILKRCTCLILAQCSFLSDRSNFFATHAGALTIYSLFWRSKNLSAKLYIKLFRIESFQYSIDWALNAFTVDPKMFLVPRENFFESIHVKWHTTCYCLPFICKIWNLCSTKLLLSFITLTFQWESLFMNHHIFTKCGINISIGAKVFNCFIPIKVLLIWIAMIRSIVNTLFYAFGWSLIRRNQ